MNRWCLLVSTAKHHESFRMELLRTWELLDSWSVAWICAAVRSQSCLLIEDGNENRMKRVKEKIGFANGFYVQREGKGGELAMFWGKEMNLEIKSFSRHHIDVVLIEEGTSFMWRITGFCGHLETHWRKELWNFLGTLNGQYKLPWLCFGDFN